MSDNWFKKYENNFFRSSTEDEVCDDVNRYLEGTGGLYVLTRHFFDRIMYSCSGREGKGLGRFPKLNTPLKALHDDDFINFMLEYMYKHRKIFRTMTELKNVDSEFTNNDFLEMRAYFRFHHPRKVSQFPPKNVKKLIGRLYPDHDCFGEPLNYHDMSCGFGMRETASLLYNCNYFGTDPNVELNVKLNELADFLKKHYSTFVQGTADIRCQGSEIFIPEWENRMDLSFSSPPYFNLEVYSNDDSASTKNYNNYDRWIKEYSIPTIKNSISYLKNGGYLCINIKNTNKYPIFDDYVSILQKESNMEQQDFINLEMDNYKSFTIVNTEDKICDRDGYFEKIMVFKKK